MAKGLGRGFDALIPQNFDNTILETTEKVQKIALDKLEPNKHQPRTTFDDQALKELAASIKQYGVLQPLVVTPKGQNFGIIAGERRWRAARLAGLDRVPAIVRTSKELEQLEIAIVENVQRVDLSPLEQAVSIERLHQQFSMSYDDIGKRLGKAATTVINTVRLLQLPPEARQALESHRISEGHARQILALKDAPDQQKALLISIIKHDWSVRQAERYVTGIKAGVKERKAAHQRVQTETPATKALTKRLKLPVSIRRTARGGKLELGFKTEEELEQIITLLSSLKN
jgi:ParB family chromosome partitioning protein